MNISNDSRDNLNPRSLSGSPDSNESLHEDHDMAPSTDGRDPWLDGPAYSTQSSSSDPSLGQIRKRPSAHDGMRPLDSDMDANAPEGRMRSEATLGDGDWRPGDPSKEPTRAIDGSWQSAGGSGPGRDGRPDDAEARAAGSVKAPTRQKPFAEDSGRGTPRKAFANAPERQLADERL